MKPGADVLRMAPKVALHDHLDGGLRPQTILEIAAEIGYRIDNPDSLLNPHSQALSAERSLASYLENFAHTTAVMQRAEDLHRVACEAVLDLAADGVVYAELRWAPEQHLHTGLTLTEAVAAVQEGLNLGRKQVADRGGAIVVHQILTARRENTFSLEIAKLAVAEREAGVVGFDLAGAELGHPALAHKEAFDYLAVQNMPVTIHAGEAFGLAAIQQAVDDCGARRIGHGVRIIEDIDFCAEQPQIGSLAERLRDAFMCFEMCPSSNLDTGALGPDASLADHPFARLAELGFNVTVNCDNRLMSHTSLTREFDLLVQEFGYSLADVERFTVNAMESAFCSEEERKRIVSEVIRPRYLALGG